MYILSIDYQLYTESHDLLCLLKAIKVGRQSGRPWTVHVRGKLVLAYGKPLQ